MDASCSSTLVLLLPFLTITTSVASLSHHLLYIWFPLPQIALLSLPLIVSGQYPNDPSTDWTLSDYYRYNVSNSSVNSNFRHSNFTVCVNHSSYVELLNEEEHGLYGRPTDIDSAHISMPYFVYFSLYFVRPATDSCLNDFYSVPSYYLSLVALNTNGRHSNRGQVVWTANPDTPVTKYACLQMNGSDLQLVDYNEYAGFAPEVVWQKSTGVADASLAISFEGNLVLFSNTTIPPYVPLWESFRQPTDTLMVLQALENPSVLTVKSDNYFYPATQYTLTLQNGRLVLYFRIGSDNDAKSQYGSPYWIWPDLSVPADDNISFVAFCWDSVNQLRLYAGSNRSPDDSHEYRGMVSPQFCSTIPSNNGRTTIQITGSDQSNNVTFATFLRLETNGDLRAYTVNDTPYPGSDATWRVIYSVFNSTPCDLPQYCGVYGMCDPERRNGNYCTCTYNVSEGDPKLVFAIAGDTQSGCILEDSSIRMFPRLFSCLHSDPVKFLTFTNVHYFYLNFEKSYQEEVQNRRDCKDECEKNCSCSAAFWNESNRRCFLVGGILGTIQQQGTMEAFIKYVMIKQYISRSYPTYLWKVVGSIVAVTPLVACLLLAYWHRRGAQEMSELQKERLQLLSLLDVDCGNTQKFTWKQMQKYTKGFSYFLGGGGFGRVFQGALPDGTVIAVKQLDEDGSQGQGDKEFIAEVSILSRIYHAHLVRLIGFCLEGMHRLLVYEYMEYGSLDAWLFRSPVDLVLQEAHIELRHLNVNQKKDNGREQLPWKKRFQIALGTAKGLAYLHEELEERIIHMDLKPQNILVSRNFQAKISDFGMSKRMGREQSSVLTVMRGTPGYLAPEWLLDCAITEKCDVYSFGIVLLELVSGRKVKDLRAVREKLSMRPLRESVMQHLLDESLRHGSDVTDKEAVTMVEVALSCVQTNPTKRPAMSSVAMMLEGREEVMQNIDALDDEDNDAMRIVQQHQVDSLTYMMESGSGTSMWISNDYDNNNQSQHNSKRKMHNKYIELQKHHEEL